MTQAFSFNSLKKYVRPQDFDDDSLNDEDILESRVRDAVALAEDGFNFQTSAKAIVVNGKQAFSTTSLDEKLVLRKVVSNIRSCFDLPFSHRDKISSELCCFIKEGVKYRLYRLDITSFFESISLEVISSSLSSLRGLSQQSKLIALDYLETFQAQFNTNGVPRGVEISSTISELVLNDFDELVGQHKDVFYYARYVDDIVIVSSTKEDRAEFIDWIQSSLPEGLFLNRKKLEVADIEKLTMQPKLDKVFEFLGYRYTIKHPAGLTGYRPITVDLSANKVKELKTKIAKSFHSFKKTGDYRLLNDRLAFMTSNRDIITSRNSKIGTGIYYSYKRIDPTASLKSDVDFFLRQNIMSQSINLSAVQRDELKKLSFYRGFTKRIHRNFSPLRLLDIVQVWK